MRRHVLADTDCVHESTAERLNRRRLWIIRGRNASGGYGRRIIWELGSLTPRKGLETSITRVVAALADTRTPKSAGGELLRIGCVKDVIGSCVLGMMAKMLS